MNWRCVWLPWHRIVWGRRISESSQHVRCSCGAEYGVNHDVGVVVPWAAVRAFYERGQS